jgi:hypothetical protein
LTAGGRPLAGRVLTLSRRLRGRTSWRSLCARRTVVIAAARPRDGAGSSAAARDGAGASAAARDGAGASAAAQDCALRTDAAGRVTVRLRRGASRTIRFAFAGDPQLLPARASTAVRAPARLRLRAIPRSVPAGGTVRFTGRLLGGHVPAGGKVVELQARVTAGWRTFATLRTDRRGRYAHVHRFATTSGGRTFWVRVRVRREAAYPFEGAVTRPLPVTVT